MASGMSKEINFLIKDGKITPENTFTCTEDHKEKKIKINGKVLFNIGEEVDYFVGKTDGDSHVTFKSY
jgi:hypothetical protein